MSILVTYRRDGAEQQYAFAPERLDELLARADARFLRPLTAEDESRFRAVLASDERRRAKTRAQARVAFRGNWR